MTTLKKYGAAPSVAKLKHSFAAVQASPAWPPVDEGLSEFTLTNCTSGKLSSPDTTIAYDNVLGGCSALLRAAVVTAEQSREPAAIDFARQVVAYVGHIARQVPAHGGQLLDSCVQSLKFA